MSDGASTSGKSQVRKQTLMHFARLSVPDEDKAVGRLLPAAAKRDTHLAAGGNHARVANDLDIVCANGRNRLVAERRLGLPADLDCAVGRCLLVEAACISGVHQGLADVCRLDQAARQLGRMEQVAVRTKAVLAVSSGVRWARVPSGGVTPLVLEPWPRERRGARAALLRKGDEEDGEGRAKEGKGGKSGAASFNLFSSPSLADPLARSFAHTHTLSLCLPACLSLSLRRNLTEVGLGGAGFDALPDVEGVTIDVDEARARGVAGTASISTSAMRSASGWSITAASSFCEADRWGRTAGAAGGEGSPSRPSLSLFCAVLSMRAVVR